MYLWEKGDTVEVFKYCNSYDESKNMILREITEFGIWCSDGTMYDKRFWKFYDTNQIIKNPRINVDVSLKENELFRLKLNELKNLSTQNT